MISPSNWEQIRALFHTALERAPAERAAFLRAQSNDDEILREVASLLAAHADADALLDAARRHEADASPARGRPALTLTSGTKLGPYVVASLLGAGAMGEVYRARDTNLRRDVALKILPKSLAADRDRLARFSREARTLGALNHPHIAQVHGFEEHGGVRALIMELVEGQDLAQYIARGPIPVAEALRIARQIAEALEAAHARGIVHRDLKPANIMVREDGTVKVLDFGLAKAWTNDLGSAIPLADTVAAPPTMTTPPIATDVGVLVGTAAYMSPEQARGGTVDRGSDIWAFGCVLYEMLTGVRAFHGAGATDTLANVLQREPAWERLPETTPAAIRVLLRRCLRKDKHERLQDAAGVRIEIEDALRDPDDSARTMSPPARPGLARRRPGLTAALVVLGMVATLALWWVARWASTPPMPTHRSSVESIAVMPFKTVGGGGEYLADGLTESLTTELGKIPGIRVIAANTAFTYRDRPTLRAIARELNVGLVVTGSVQRDRDSMSIHASVVDTSDGATLWSEHFSRTMADVLKVQNDISVQIAHTLSRRVGVAPPATSGLATRSGEAYEAYLRGLWHLKGRSLATPIVMARADSWRSAARELERAVALDSEFALARAALATAYTQLYFYSATGLGFDQKAFVEIERALRIDPRLSEAYLARAQLTWTALNRFPHEAAITDLRRALALNPNLADAHIELEKIYYHIGLTDKVIAAGEQVQRLDPSQGLSSNRTFRALVDAGRLEQVRLAMERDQHLGPYARGDALIALGRLHDALRYLSGSQATRPDDASHDVGAVALLGVVHARLNQPEEAEKVLAMVIPEAENVTALSHLHHAQLHIGATLGLLGRKDEAVRWLTKAAEEGYPSYPRFSTDPSLTPLKGYPAYEALLQRLRIDWERWKGSL